MNGKVIRDMVSDMNDLVMAIYMKVNTFKAKFKDKDVMNGNQVSSMRDSGSMGRKMAMEYGKALKLTLMLDNGKLISHMALENTFGATETNMKVNGKLASDMDKVATNLLSVTST